MSIFALIYLVLVSLFGIITAYLLPLPAIAALLVGPATGVIALTTITLVTSWVFGFTPLVIWLTLFILCLLLIIVSKKLKYSRKLSFKFTWIIITTYLKRHWSLLVFFATIGLYAAYIFLTQVLASSAYGLVTGGGGLYGDTALHSAYTMGLVEQGLPPVNPLFARQVLIYPFLVNFFSATLVKLGSDLHWAFVLPHLVYLSAFITLFYLVCKKFLNNLGVFLSFLIFSLGWGLGFIPYLKQVIVTGNWTITSEITNNMVDFHLHNPFTGLLFPERSMLPGLVIGLLITYLIIYKSSNNTQYKILNTKYIIIGLLLGILPLWHTHTFIFFVVSVALWLIFDLLFEQNNKHIGKTFAQLSLIYLTAFIVALPTLIWFATSLDHGRFLHFSLGWITSGDNQLVFWLKNSGIFLPLVFIGLIKMPVIWRKYFYPAIFMFITANLVIFQPWDWDNIKLFTWIFLFLSIPVSFYLSRLFRSNFFLKVLSFVCLVSLTVSGFLSLLKQTQATFTIYDKQDMDLAVWTRKSTKPTDVFLVDPWPNHPITGLTGRSVYLGYPGHLWVHGIDYGKREQQAQKILSGSTQITDQLDVPVSYIVTDKNSKVLTGLEKIYSNQKFSVFKIR